MNSRVNRSARPMYEELDDFDAFVPPMDAMPKKRPPMQTKPTVIPRRDIEVTGSAAKIPNPEDTGSTQRAYERFRRESPTTIIQEEPHVLQEAELHIAVQGLIRLALLLVVFIFKNIHHILGKIVQWVILPAFIIITLLVHI